MIAQKLKSAKYLKDKEEEAGKRKGRKMRKMKRRRKKRRTCLARHGGMCYNPSSPDAKTGK